MPYTVSTALIYWDDAKIKNFSIQLSTEEVCDLSTEIFDHRGTPTSGHVYRNRQVVNHLIIVINDPAVAAMPCLTDAPC